MSKHEMNRFILRGEVVKLYRRCLKAAQMAPPDARGAFMGDALLLLLAAVLSGDALLLDHCVQTCPLTSLRRAEGIREHIKHGFCVQRGKKDLYEIKYALHDGREQLKQFVETMSLSSRST
jgi:hypothetical protein